MRVTRVPLEESVPAPCSSVSDGLRSRRDIGK